MADQALLIARMEVSLRNLEKGMQKAGLIADKGVKDIEKKFASANLKLPDSFGKQIGAALAGFATIGTVQAIRNAVGSLAAIGDEAAKIGVTTAQLQAFQFAAQSSGASAETAARGLEMFSQKLSEAAAKGGPLADLLKANNVALRDQAGVLIPVQTQLENVANLVKNASSEQDRLNIVTRAFGSGAGPDLVNALRLGADGLKETTAEAIRLGVIFDEDTLKKAKELDDSFTRLEIVASAWLKTMALEIANVVGPLDGIIEQIRTVTGFMQVLDKLAGGAKPGDKGGIPGVITNLLGSGLLTNPTKAIDDAKFAIEEELGIQDLQPGGGGGGGRLHVDVGGGGGRPTVIPPPARRGGGRRGGRTPRATRDSAGETITDLQNELRLTQAIGDEREQAQLTLDTTNALQRAGVNATAEQKQQITELVAAIAEAEKAQKLFNEALNNIQDVAETGLSSFVSGLREGKSAVESLEGALDSVLDTILRIAQQQLLAGLFGQTPGGGALGGLLGGLFGGGATPIGAGGIGHAARGGITNGLTIAGEAGTEAVVPLPDGRRIPVAMQGGAGGDIQVVVNAPPGSRVASQRQERGPDFRRVIVDIVKDEFSGGGMDAPMQGRFGARPRKVR